MSIKIASMNFADCDTILHNTPNGMKNVAEVLGPNGEVYWSATKELTGVPPLSIKSNGTLLLDYLISGNMSQTGTPTSSDPIQPQETGERTRNLFDKSKRTDNSRVVYTTGEVGALNGIFVSDFTPIEPNTTYTLNIVTGITDKTGHLFALYDENKNFVDTGTHEATAATVYTFTTSSNVAYIRFNGSVASVDSIMLNTGSTALPYEPYGYKIPISSGGNNLFDKSTAVIGERVLQNSVTADAGAAHSDYIDITGIGTLTVNKKYAATNFYFYADKTNTSIGYVNGFTADIPTGAKYCRINVLKDDVDTIMLNRGSTAIPYEPYNRTTTPVYLGEVQTTRKIKKLVLTGDETIRYSSQNVRFYFSLDDSFIIGLRITPMFCSHYQCIDDGRPLADIPDNSIYSSDVNSGRWFIKDIDYTSAADFKSFLAQQYANGTPVTVWYVLTNETTGIVNEPIRKIGTYADTVSMEQAGVQIPTNRGNTVIDVETELKPSQIYIKYK